MNAPAIEITAVTKRLGQFALGPLSLSVPRGAIYGLIGHNGAGKTTTMDLLMAMGQPDSGSIRVLGRELARDEVEIKRRVAYVSPDLNYQAYITVAGAIKFVSRFYPDWNTERCLRLQNDFGIQAHEKIASLSFGARTKLALVLALSRNAELLLLDEPTLGLDAVSRRVLFAELLAFMQQEDRTILISSHQLADLERFADHAAFINDGRLFASARMDQFVERYVQLQVRAHPSLTAAAKDAKPGIYVIRHDEQRALILLDTSAINQATLVAMGIEIIGETPATLEDIFVAVTGPAKDNATQSQQNGVSLQ